MRPFLAAALFLLFCAPSSFSQRRSSTPPEQLRNDELPVFPIDTVATGDPDTKIVMYSNNTWRYYRDLSKIYGKLPAYQTNWNTEQIFSYPNHNLASLPEVVELCLCDSVLNYTIPVKGRVLSKYGVRKRRHHNGVDIPLKLGEPILAAFDGKVRYAKYNTGGYGYLVIVRHPNQLETWYAHLSKLNVDPGDYVKSGQIIGYGGSTGRSSGPHLHFETRYYDQTFDPEFIFDFDAGCLRAADFALHKRYFNIDSKASEILEEDDPDDNAPMLADLSPDNAAASAARAGQATVAAAPQPLYHTVKEGDMLGKLAVKYGVTVNQICRLNNITPTTILSLGRRLRIK